MCVYTCVCEFVCEGARARARVYVYALLPEYLEFVLILAVAFFCWLFWFKAVSHQTTTPKNVRVTSWNIALFYLFIYFSRVVLLLMSF